MGTTQEALQNSSVPLNWTPSYSYILMYRVPNEEADEDQTAKRT
jgi:hypothetical protein